MDRCGLGCEAVLLGLVSNPSHSFVVLEFLQVFLADKNYSPTKVGLRAWFDFDFDLVRFGPGTARDQRWGCKRVLQNAEIAQEKASESENGWKRKKTGTRPGRTTTTD